MIAGDPSDAPTPDPLVSASAGDWLAKSGAALRRSLVSLVAIQLLVLLPVVALALVTDPVTFFADGSAAVRGFGYFYGYTGNSAAAPWLAAVLGLVGVTASTFVIIADAAGRPRGLGAVAGFVGRRVLPLAGWVVLAGIVIAIGLVLLVLPGLVAIAIFLGGLFGAVLVERAGARRAFDLAWPDLGRVLGRALVLLAVWVVGGLVALLPSLLVGWGAYPGEPRLIVAGLLGTLVRVPVAAFVVCALVVLYAELRARREPGTAVSTLAAEVTA